ncbi:MAG: hypothetical protein U5Q16_07410 [Gammaproteobacteria bacterium]|nr:hypothetical protein [Gammaproteobacteria bacterium]
MIEARTARFADALFLADRLRYEDAREIAGVWGVGAREGLFLCLLHSDRAFTLVEQGHAVALCGVTDSNCAGLRIGVPWLLAGEHLFGNRRWVVRHSRAWIDHLLLDYDVLNNLTGTDNVVHLRWLAWCGFLPLRDIPAYGRSGRPFREFYRVNERRGVHPDSVHDLLLARPVPAGGLSADSPERRLAGVGIDLLADVAAVEPAAPTRLAECLQALGCRAVNAGTQRIERAALRLLQEAAPRIDAAQDVAELGAWCEALAELHVVCTLEAGPEPAEVVQSLPPRRLPRLLAEAAAGRLLQRPDGGGDAVARLFGQMVQHYQRTLTLDHRVTAVHGYRLHGAALGISTEAVNQPLGVSRDDVQRLISEHYVTEFLCGAGDAAGGGIALARRRLQQRPLIHGDVLARVASLAGRAPWAGTPLAPALRDSLNQWTTGGCGVNCLADAVTLSASLAHGVALRCLPGFRLGGVDSAYAERHGLYRLLRAAILLAAVEGWEPATGPLLMDEAAGLLAVNRLDDALLTAPAEQARRGEEPTLLLTQLSALWGPAMAGDDDLAYLCGMLAPGMVVPVTHALQLPAALLAWHLTVSGALPEAIAEVGEILGRRQPAANARGRRCASSYAAAALRWVWWVCSNHSSVMPAMPQQPSADPSADRDRDLMALLCRLLRAQRPALADALTGPARRPAASVIADLCRQRVLGSQRPASVQELERLGPRVICIPLRGPAVLLEAGGNDTFTVASAAAGTARAVTASSLQRLLPCEAIYPLPRTGSERARLTQLPARVLPFISSSRRRFSVWACPCA